MSQGSFGRTDSGGSQPFEQPGREPGRTFVDDGPQGFAPGPNRGSGGASVPQGFPQTTMPTPPLREAPARMGVAGISAGEDRFFKTDIDNAGPDLRYGEPEDKLAQALGWFSIGLGLLEVANARGLSNWLGVEGREGLIRAYGLREIGTGVAILAQRDSVGRSPWLWARVAGDGLDLYTLQKAKRQECCNHRNVNFAMAAVAGVTALDIMAAGLLSEK